jgi:hypothetical protein
MTDPAPRLEVPVNTVSTTRSLHAPSTTHWPLERILFAMAGTVTLLSALLAALVSPWFVVLTAFVGINQWLYVTVRGCPASVVLRHFGVKAQCRW